MNGDINKLREILKMEKGTERYGDVADLLSKYASVGPDIVMKHKDVGFATGAYFGAFTFVALLLTAAPPDEDPANILDLIHGATGMVTHAIMEKEKEHGEK